jgi:hypothetical protein
MGTKFPPKLQADIISHLRRLGYRNIHYKQAMASAHQEYGQWKCAGCGDIVKRSDLHGDHTEPVIDPEKGFEDWNIFMERLFLNEIRPLCKQKCHAQKTKAENAVRKRTRDERNKS